MLLARVKPLAVPHLRSCAREYLHVVEPRHGRQSDREEDQAAKRIDGSKRELRTKGARDDEKKGIFAHEC